MHEQRGAVEHVDAHVLAAAREAQLHAPPGGVSSITFGPGGLGTVEAAVDESEKVASAAPLPPWTGAYTSSSTSNNNNNSGNYDYAPPMNQKSGTPGGYNNYGSAATPSSSYGSYGQNNNWGDQYGQHPAIGAPPMSYGAGPPMSASRPLSSGSSACSSRSWGSQPPLTSSKRDQNWERKRRQWLARKNGSGPGSSAGSMSRSLSSGGGPPGPSYSSGMMSMNPYMEDHHGPAYAPPSPLSKFVHQQSQKQQGGFGGGFVDYERIGTAQSQSPAPLPMPPYTSAAYNDSYGYSGGGSQMAPPSRSGGGGFNNYNPPTPQAIGHGGRDASSGGGGGMSHPHQAASDSSYGVHYGAGGYGYGDATPASRGGTAVAGVSTSGGGGGYAGVSGNGNTGNRNVSSARQPPGGHSNWSPFN